MRRLWRTAALALGGAHTLVAMRQQSMNPDGIRYLEMGAAYWRADWDMAINGIWSPLYGILTAGALRLVEPSMQAVFPAVQVVNFLIFSAALVAFELFWGQVVLEYEERSAAWPEVRLDRWLFWSIGYALFVWSSLNLVEMWTVTPDMLVAVTVYAAAGCGLNIMRGGGMAPRLGLGVSLGIGYLAKAAMFPLSLAGFVILAVAARGRVPVVRTVAPAIIAFVVCTGPFLVALSISEGHPTFSEVSRFTYLKHVNRVAYPTFGEEVVPRHGAPLHPPRRIQTRPDVWSYQGPVGGSYPPAYDPAYFTAGLEASVDLGEQANAVAFNLAYFFQLFFRTHGAFTVLALLAGMLSWPNHQFDDLRSGTWWLGAWAVVCFAMYAVVLAENRYVAPFVVLFWAGWLGYWRLGEGGLAQRLSKGVGVLMVLAILADVGALNADGFTSVVGMRRPVEAPSSRFSDGPTASSPDVAGALADAGVGPGTDIALVGYGFYADWAYLADVRIVAEIPPAAQADLWALSVEDEARVLDVLGDTGARVVVAESPPPGEAPRAPWRPLGRRGYWFAPLR